MPTSAPQCLQYLFGRPEVGSRGWGLEASWPSINAPEPPESSGAPQLPQYFMFGTFFAPHFLQKAGGALGSSRPHSLQNFEPGGFSFPQFPHTTISVPNP
jgi:hypothetical protein